MRISILVLVLLGACVEDNGGYRPVPGNGVVDWSPETGDEVDPRLGDDTPDAGETQTPDTGETQTPDTETPDSGDECQGHRDCPLDQRYCIRLETGNLCRECTTGSDCPGEGEVCRDWQCVVEAEPEPQVDLFVRMDFRDSTYVQVNLHLARLDIPLTGDDFDGDGRPDPWFTPADCYTERQWGGCRLLAGPSSQQILYRDPYPTVYMIGVSFDVTTESIPADVDIRISHVGGLRYEDVRLRQGDFWCVAFVDVLAKTSYPCLDDEGNPRITSDYGVLNP